MTTTTPARDSLTTDTAISARTPAARGGRPTTFSLGYFGYDLLRNVRMVSNLIFTIGLPLAMYFIFGAMQEYGAYEHPSGNGNIAATVMVPMAMYGAVVATSSLAGMAAVEMQQGWGRQLGLTPFTHVGYILSKIGVALVIAILPVIAIFIGGALSGSKIHEAWIWPMTALLILVGAIVFALYGLAFGLFFRSEAAVSAASGLTVVLMFLGDAFVPLSGFLKDMAPFTPVWGVMKLAEWPLTQGQNVLADGSVTTYELWQPIVNIAAWALVFAALCLVAARRHTSRR